MDSLQILSSTDKGTSKLVSRHLKGYLGKVNLCMERLVSKMEIRTKVRLFRWKKVVKAFLEQNKLRTKDIFKTISSKGLVCLFQVNSSMKGNLRKGYSMELAH